MVDPRLKELSGTHRRDFLKWSATVAALLGLERSRFLDVLSSTSGTAMADDGACGKTTKSVHLIAGNGGLAWFTQLFPYSKVAKSGDNQLAYYGAPTDVKDAPTDNPSVYGKYSPFQTLGKSKQMTMFVAGTNQTHTNTPNTGLQLGNNGLIAAIASIQSANPSLLPVMAINPFVFGAAPGAPAVATVANPTGLVDLFNSAASKTVLQDPKNAALSEAYYKAFLQLNAAAPRQTTVKTYGTGKVAANLLGKNLSDQLRVLPADEAPAPRPTSWTSRTGSSSRSRPSSSASRRRSSCPRCATTRTARSRT
jgi:TAT (twin-arginine translocation) pathway signal sequence